MKKLYRILPLLFVLTAISAYSCNNSSSEKTTQDTVIQPDTLVVKEKKKAKLYFVGDAMQHQKQLTVAQNVGNGQYDYSECFTLIEPIAKEADYAVVNLEVALGGGQGGYTGYPCFSAPDAFAYALKDAGFDMFLTANNHTLDRSDRGLRRTLDVLDSMKVDHIGTYRNRDERLQKVPFVKDINGMPIGFLNYTYGTNGILARDGAEVSYIDKKEIEREIKATREAGAKFVIVCIHWGDEYVLHENRSQRDVADFLLTQGVDMIIGGHPHVIQPMHLVDNPVSGKKSLVVYSLGNFISNMLKTDCQGGASVVCDIEEQDDGNIVITGVNYDTFYCAKPAGAKSNFRVIPSSQVDSIPRGQLEAWKRFNANAEKVFSTSNTDVPRLNPSIK